MDKKNPKHVANKINEYKNIYNVICLLAFKYIKTNNYRLSLNKMVIFVIIK
jgi:hypothetical protein